MNQELFTLLELRSKDFRDEKGDGGDSCFQHKVVI